MKIVTAAEMREIDRVTSERFGVPPLTLMENAGAAIVQFLLSAYPTAQRIGIICGKGNNGGDGLVVARRLPEWGREVRLLLLADRLRFPASARACTKRSPNAATTHRPVAPSRPALASSSGPCA